MVNTEPMNATRVNLIPQARREAKRQRRRLRRWGVVLTTYGLALALVSSMLHMFGQMDNRALASQLEGLAAGIEKSQGDQKTIRTELKRAKTIWQSNHAVGDQPDWSVLLALLARHVGDDVVLRSCTLAPSTGAEAVASNTQSGRKSTTLNTPAPSRASTSQDPDQFRLELTGLGRSQNAITQFVLHLEQIKLFDKVRLVETRREPFLSSDAVAFRIECSLEESTREHGS